MIEIPGVPNSNRETLTVSSTAVGPTDNTFGTNNTGAILVQVLSNSVFFSLHAATCTPSITDFVAYAGDMFTVQPAKMLRMIRNGSDSCVKLQGFE